MSDAAALLAQCELFSVFTPEQRAQLLAAMRTEDYAAGQTLFHKDDAGDYCLLVLAGRLRVYVATPEGKEVLIETMEPGDLVGEMALLDGLPRSASAEAMEATRCLRLDRAPFRAILAQKGEALWALVRLLSLRLRRTTGQMEMIALMDLPSRLARYLLELAERYGESGSGGLRVRSGLKQSEMAQHLAASRESLNKVLSLWQAQGVISLLLQQDILIVQKDKLIELAKR